MGKLKHEHDWIFKVLEWYFKKEKDGKVTWEKEVKLVWICFSCLEVEYKPSTKEELEKIEVAS